MEGIEAVTAEDCQAHFLMHRTGPRKLAGMGFFPHGGQQEQFIKLPRGQCELFQKLPKFWFAVAKQRFESFNTDRIHAGRIVTYPPESGKFLRKPSPSGPQ